jgi:hypothetical protein
MQFTYDSYKRVIDALRANGYTIGRYTDDVGGKFAILRHDVDLSLDKALSMARFEYELAAKSTYFFLLSSVFYNLASDSGVRTVREISKMGHTVGLHFDEAKYYNKEGYDPSFESHVKQEVGLFRDITGIEVDSFSMHQPSKVAIDANHVIGGLANAYSNTFMNDFYYISDSCRYWRADPIAEIESGDHDFMQILSHPFWYNKREKTLHDSLAEYIIDGSSYRYNNLVAKVPVYSDAYPKDEFDAFSRSTGE